MTRTDLAYFIHRAVYLTIVRTAVVGIALALAGRL